MLQGLLLSVRIGQPLPSCRPRSYMLHTEVGKDGLPGWGSALREATPKGFEPLRAEPNGSRVHFLNHSDTVSIVCNQSTSVQSHTLAAFYGEREKNSNTRLDREHEEVSAQGEGKEEWRRKKVEDE